MNQIAGRDTVEQRLNDLLQNPGYDRLRYLVAYVRWSGLHLIDVNLQNFSSRGSIDGIVGIDFGGTTVEALSYLKELPNSRVRIFQSGDPTVGFHPKIFIFSGPLGWAVIVGSANATTGGLFNNVEICVVATGRPREANPFDEVWRRFSEPCLPVKPDNVVSVDDQVLEEVAQQLDHYSERAPDRPRRGAFRSPSPVERAGNPRPPGRPPAPTRARGRRKRTQPGVTTRTAPTGGPKTLYVELWNETGGGTQVQLPKAAVTDYFGADLTAITWLNLTTPTGRTKVRIQVFPNDTYRLPLGFTETVPRKAVLQFQRLGADQYRVRAVSRGHRSYRAWLKRCTQQRRWNSKRWGVQ